MEKMNKPSKIFLALITLSVLLVIIATAYKFLWLKDYNFYVEAVCDPEIEICFYRDCSIPDDCPPNGLEHYRAFEVPAGDFSNCSDNSCLAECVSGKIQCNELICDESEGYECSFPTNLYEELELEVEAQDTILEDPQAE